MVTGSEQQQANRESEYYLPEKYFPAITRQMPEGK